MADSAVLICTNLKKKVRGKLLYKDFSFSFQAGQIYLFLGESGVGKTTLLKSLCGLKKTKGKVKKRKNLKIGCFFFSCSLYSELTVEQNKEIHDYNFSKEEGETIYLPLMSQKVSQLSSGEKTTYGMLSVLRSDCDLLILDDPLP